MNRQDLTGQTLGQYELRELIGAGGMGAVYRAYQANLKRVVAVKVLPTELSAQPGYIERFTREATTAAALEHAHIVPVYDYGTQRNISYVVMRLLTGGSLSERLARRAGDKNPLPSLGETADLLNQLASALDYAHSQGVVHRDIKPPNVMFDNQGSAYLMDFGIAKLLESTSHLTGTGMTMGTPSYMAPEQWRAEDVSPATDQYALGVMIYQLVTGKLPFEAPTPYALMHKHLNEIPTPPNAWRPGVPDAVAEVLQRAMAKQPGERFPAVTAFAQAFQRAIQGIEGPATSMFTFPLARKTEPTSPARTADTATSKPLPETIVEAGSASVPVPTQVKPRPFYRIPWVWLAALVVIVLIAGGVYLLSHLQLAGPYDVAAQPTPSPTAVVAVVATNTVKPVEPTTTPPIANPSATALSATDVESTFQAAVKARLEATQHAASATANAQVTAIQESLNQTATAAYVPPTATTAPTVASATPAGPPTVSVPVDGRVFGILTLRDAPDDQSRSLGQFASGVSLSVFGRTADAKWLFVRSTSLTGWVVAAGVRFVDNTIGVEQLPVISATAIPLPAATAAPAALPTVSVPVDGSAFGSLTLRETPDDQARSLGQFASGASLAVFGRTEDAKWLFVRSRGVTGWVVAAGVRFVDSTLSVDQIPVISSTTATPTAAAAARVIRGKPLKYPMLLRHDPALDASAEKVSSEDSFLGVIGRSGDAQWLLIAFGGSKGWVAVQDVALTDSSIRIADIPVVSGS